MNLAITWRIRALAKAPANAPYGVVGGAVVCRMLPNVPGPKPVALTGFWKLGWFSTLYAFAPSCSAIRSVTRKSFRRLRSVLK